MGIPPPNEDIHSNRDVVQALASAKQTPMHEEELILALVTSNWAEGYEYAYYINTDVVQMQQKALGKKGDVEAGPYMRLCKGVLRRVRVRVRVHRN